MVGKRMMIVLLLSVMALVYVPSLYAEETVAEETVAEEVITDDNKNMEGEGEEESKEETDDDPEEETDEDVETEPESPVEPPQPEKVWETFKIQIAEPDGEAGYYRTRPNIVIYHMDKQGSTNYMLINENSEITRGSISGEGRLTTISGSKLKEGVQRLVVYMSDDNGEQLDDGTGRYRVEKEIRVDTMVPEVEVTAPSGFESWYQDDVIITVNANDTGSGTEVIQYYINGLMVKKEEVQGENVTSKFTVVPPSDKGQNIPVKIEVLDQAGNLTVINKGVYLDKRDPQITVTGALQHEITSRDIELKVRVSDENGIASWRMSGEREETNGKIRVLEQSGEKTVYLSAEGIYRLEFQTVDLAGRSSTTNLQVIIDKTDPVIRLIDELDGTYVREFRLNVTKEEMIEEFSSYDLVMNMNGRLYNAQDTIYDEGQQLLKVQVKDAAGNESKTEARFTIDRTKPEIIFSGITDGQECEGEAEIKIDVDNPEDTLEDIRINGKKMTVESGAFHGVFKDAGEYKVTAVAVDKAGNTTKESIAFTLKSNEKAGGAALGLFSRMLEKKTIKNDGKENVKQSKVSVIIVILILITGIIMGMKVAFKQRRIPR